MGKKVKGALRRLDGSPGQEAALLFPTYTGDAASVPLMHNDVNRLVSPALPNRFKIGRASCRERV